jgi:parallel beta-helix repeat protein
MTRRSLLFVLFSLFTTVPMLAQQRGELRVSFWNEARTSDLRFQYLVRAQWNGADPLHAVVLELDAPGTIVHVNPVGFGMECTNTNPVRCTIPELKPNEQPGVAVQVTFAEAGVYTATATVTAPGNRRSSATHHVEVAGLPELRGGFNFRDSSIDPGAEGIVDLGVSNQGAATTNVVLRGRIEGGTILRAEPLLWGFGPPTSTCTVADGEVTCHIPSMPGGYHFELVRLTYIAPDRREGGRVVATGSVSSDRPDYDPENDTFRTELALRRMFVVTSAGDDGAGTLRQAIPDAVAACEKTQCTIAFEGVSVIQPRSPLPGIRGTIRIDGRAPRLLLDGSLLASGHGLVFEGGCGLDVRHLDIRNFPGHAIEGRQDSRGLQFSCLEYGLYVRGTILSHSERGVVAKGIDTSLRQNVIHDQRRAGIFIDGVYYSEIYNNVVVNNGATGIFINTSTEPQFGGIPPGADLVENIVHGNAEWGIARTRNGLVGMVRNSTIRNGLYGFDVGLDLNTPNRADDRSGIPNKPVLESATYDEATNTTIIRGSAPFGWNDFYASSSLSRYGYPEAERWLGERPTLLNQQLELRVPGDLRGQWITATSTRNQTLYFLRDGGTPRSDVYRPATGRDTSELSDPIQVQ